MSAEVIIKGLAILGGKGALPLLAAQRFPEALYLTIGGNGLTPGRTGDFLIKLRRQGIKKLCMIGGMLRPNWLSLWPSWQSWKLIFKYGFSFAGGDDALLKRLRRILEGEGFQIVGIHTLMPDLLAPEGVLAPPAQDVPGEDARLMIEQAHSYGRSDKGQAIAIAPNGHLIGTEDKFGTNALIYRCARQDAILVKAAKPQQDLDLDMPTIGPETVEKAALAGFRAIVVEAGKTLMIERDKCVDLAKKHNIGLIGVAA